MDVVYSLGYREEDINGNTDISFFCQYPIGCPLPDGWADSREYGYTPDEEWYGAAR
tara:strand:+ start:465 stop:632 length:168 start_codon:yes stop_codon:yes gene_type:complete